MVRYSFHPSLAALFAHLEMGFEERIEVQVIERTIDRHQFITMIARARAAGQRLADLFPDTLHGLRLDQMRLSRWLKSRCWLSSMVGTLPLWLQHRSMSARPI